MDPIIGEIRIVAFNFAPRGWALCNGQLLSIQQNAALFSILGTSYGGNGINNFALPNFQGRMPVSSGPAYTLGQMAGTETQTLTLSELPTHTHQVTVATQTGTVPTVTGNVLANAAIYNTAAPLTAMSAASVSTGGGSQPHSNLAPSLTLNFIIALVGIYPSRN